MRKVVHKLLFIWQYDKEEAWLNEMAAKGLALTSVGLLRYEFEETLPGEYGVCLQFLKQKGAERENYIRFLEDTGAEHVGSLVGWEYFRKKTGEDGEPFALFSDAASKIDYLTVIMRWIFFIGFMNLWIGGYNVFLYFLNRARGGAEISLLGLVNIVLSLFCFGGIIRLAKKRKKLKEEQNIFE